MKDEQKGSFKKQNHKFVEYFNTIQKKCASGNAPLHICDQKDCLNNPFTCSNEQCKCFSLHEQCHLIQYKIFCKKLQKQNSSTSKLQQNISDLFDQVIDKISQKRDEIILKIKQNKQQITLQPETVQQMKILNNQLEKTGLTGSIINKISKVIHLEQNNKKIQQIQTKFKKYFEQFKDKNLSNYFGKIDNIIFLNKFNKNVFWNAAISSQNNIINNRIVDQPGSSGLVNFTLLAPSIDQIQGNILRFKIKINKISSWIGLGICSRVHIQKTKYSVKTGWNDENLHGCYTNGNNKYTYYFQNKSQNHVNKGISFTSNHTVQVQINKASKAMTFNNLTNNQKFQLTIPDTSTGEYNICVALYGSNNQIQFVQQMLVDEQKVQFGQI